jgi:hypothetical protein
VSREARGYYCKACAKYFLHMVPRYCFYSWLFLQVSSVFSIVYFLVYIYIYIYMYLWIIFFCYIFRYNVKVNVDDRTGQAVFALFDLEMYNLIDKKCTELFIDDKVRVIFD